MENIESLINNALSFLQHGKHFFSGDVSSKWAIGGSVAMHLAYQHRQPANLNISLRDAQFLTRLSPRINVLASVAAESYYEESSELGLSTGCGDLIFRVEPFISKSPIKTITLCNQLIIIETPVEIVTKKLFYKASQLQAKDIFDIACVLLREPDQLFNEAGLFIRRIDALEQRICEILVTYKDELYKQVVPHSSEFDEIMQSGLEMMMLFIQALKEKREQICSLRDDEKICCHHEEDLELI